ncbi:MAG TPA: DUF6069 family protein [Actinopolymorphaceae bacterium]
MLDRPSRPLAVAGAAVAGLVTWLVADPLIGVDLAARLGPEGAVQPIGPVQVVVAALVAGLAGWGLLVLCERLSPRGRTLWTFVALAVLLVSLAGPLTQGVGTGTKITLVLMHLVVAAVLLPVLAHADSRGAR